MAGKSSAFENDLLKLIFNGTAIANLADNAAASPLANLYVSLHTADPTDGGNQSSSEISYTGYARVAVARNGGAFVVSGSTVNPAANIDFPLSTGGTGGTATHFAIGIAASGATKFLYAGPISPTIAVANGVTPRLTPATAVSEG